MGNIREWLRGIPDGSYYLTCIIKSNIIIPTAMIIIPDRVCILSDSANRN